VCRLLCEEAPKETDWDEEGERDGTEEGESGSTSIGRRTLVSIVGGVWNDGRSEGNVGLVYVRAPRAKASPKGGKGGRRLSICQLCFRDRLGELAERANVRCGVPCTASLVLEADTLTRLDVGNGGGVSCSAFGLRLRTDEMRSLMEKRRSRVAGAGLRSSGGVGRWPERDLLLSLPRTDRPFSTDRPRASESGRGEAGLMRGKAAGEYCGVGKRGTESAPSRTGGGQSGVCCCDDRALAAAGGVACCCMWRGEPKRPFGDAA
jgi:hypothetical protein